MANNRCFDSFNTILSASEYSNEKRQRTIVCQLGKNIQEFNTTDPVKHNGSKYNINSKINPTCDVIVMVSNYKMKNDIIQGMKLV